MNLLAIDEIVHILHLIEKNKRDGWYSGNPQVYWTTSQKLEVKLFQLSATLSLEAARGRHQCWCATTSPTGSNADNELNHS